MSLHFNPFLYSVFILVSLIFAGCGDANNHIADQVKFRILFQTQEVKVSFVLNPKLSTSLIESFSFGSLGRLFIQGGNRTEIGAIIHATPSNLKQQNYRWKSGLPGNRSLPAAVPGVKIKEALEGDHRDKQLFFLEEPELVVGGAFEALSTWAIPKKFFATQTFKSPNGETEATLSLVGPTDYYQGGIFFFGNFGTNPFMGESTTTLSTEQILYAKEPLIVHTWGENRSQLEDIDPKNLFNQLLY